MFHFHAVANHAPLLHFGVRRSPLAEVAADAGLLVRAALLWLLFALAVAQPSQGKVASLHAASPVPAALREHPAPARPDAAAQPEPGPYARGVAPCDPGGAG